jgi:hypothetical protein
MHAKISPETKREVLAAFRERYQQAPKDEKSRILDEFVALVQCHRKHAVRVLREKLVPDPVAAESLRLQRMDDEFTWKRFAKRSPFSGKPPIASAANG